MYTHQSGCDWRVNGVDTVDVILYAYIYYMLHISALYGYADDLTLNDDEWKNISVTLITRRVKSLTNEQCTIVS